MIATLSEGSCCRHGEVAIANSSVIEVFASKKFTHFAVMPSGEETERLVRISPIHDMPWGWAISL